MLGSPDNLSVPSVSLSANWEQYLVPVFSAHSGVSGSPGEMDVLTEWLPLGCHALHSASVYWASLLGAFWAVGCGSESEGNRAPWS